MTGKKLLAKESWDPWWLNTRAQRLESLLCDLGLGARVSFCAFNFLMRKVGGKPSTDNTVRDTGMAVGHVQERFLTRCQVDKKQAITGSGAFAADSLETEEERSCSSVIL